jgi:SAM-dependent methyltransferase
MDSVPAFDKGWLSKDGRREPFLVYADDPSVNWSAELEELHADESRTHFIDVWTRSAIVAALGELEANATIVDLGCSTGYLLSDLRAARPDATLVGVDLVSSGLHKAHALVPEARLLKADACALPLCDASVEAVVSANLLEHVPDDLRALREFARVLRPGACAVVVVPIGPGLYDYYDRFLGHTRRYARGELERKARDAGLDVVGGSYLGSVLYPAFWLVKKRNRLVSSHLTHQALEARVAADISRTRDSRAGRLAVRLEQRLLDARVNLPFGIRRLVILRARAVTAL